MFYILFIRYEPDLNCHWTVVGPRDKVIKMRFTSFDLGKTINREIYTFENSEKKSNLLSLSKETLILHNNK